MSARSPSTPAEVFCASVWQGGQKINKKLLIYFLAISGYSKNFFFFKKNLKNDQ
jgi:hypothetical protein